MEEVRLGVIGAGGMAQNHMATFEGIPRLKYTAVADVVADNVKKCVDQFGVTGFDKGEDLIDSGLCDAVLIATPHYFHPVFAKAAFAKGLHVLTEKPVAVTVQDAREMNEAYQQALASKPDLKFAAMFQNRQTPKWELVKRLIDEGQLGEIKRVLWVATYWFRSQAYYDSGSWRATWAGEGGGVLLNQCPHDLDLLYWMFGQPARVSTTLALGKYHNIEVEDDVTSVWEYPSGATTTFIASTGEAPGSNHVEFIGDRGTIRFNDAGDLEFRQTSGSVKDYTFNSANKFGGLETTKITMVPPGKHGGHAGIHKNFVDAILDDAPLIAPALEGEGSIELANAMILSGIEKRTVDLPLDGPAYNTLLKKLIDDAKAKA